MIYNIFFISMEKKVFCTRKIDFQQRNRWKRLLAVIFLSTYYLLKSEWKIFQFIVMPLGFYRFITISYQSTKSYDAYKICSDS